LKLQGQMSLYSSISGIQQLNVDFRKSSDAAAGHGMDIRQLDGDCGTEALVRSPSLRPARSRLETLGAIKARWAHCFELRTAPNFDSRWNQPGSTRITSCACAYSNSPI